MTKPDSGACERYVFRQLSTIPTGEKQAELRRRLAAENQQITILCELLARSRSRVVALEMELANFE